MDTRILLLEDPSSPCINTLYSIQQELLPEYSDWDPHNMAQIRVDEKGRPCVEIYMGFCGNVLAGFMQVSYIYYYSKVFINVDFIAVLPEYRKSGLGIKLLRYLKHITQKPVENYKCMGILGMAEVENMEKPFSLKRLLLYSRLGAEIRRDLIYRTPDYPDSYVIFYPASKHYSGISTAALSWQLWRISQYDSKQFRRYVVNIDFKDIKAELSRY